MLKTKIHLLYLCMALTACDNAASDRQNGQIPPAQIDMVTLKAQPITVSLNLPGRTTSVKVSEVRPQVDGVILKRLFTEGSSVKAGQPLYQIDPSTYEASYEKARAQLNNAAGTLNRYRVLVKENAISKQSFDDARSEYEQAQADVKTAKVNLGYTQIRAPISGKISRSQYTEGALVTNGQTNPLTTITQLDPIYVDVSQASNDLLTIRRALVEGKLKEVNDHEAAVALTLEDGTRYQREGHLEFSEVTVNEGTGTVNLRAEFPNPEGVLLPGMFVHADLKQGIQEKGLLVPQEAIQHDSKGKPYVFIIGQDNKVSERSVSTGQMVNGNWQILTGLQENERVAVSGLQKIGDGVVVKPTERDRQNEKNDPSSFLSITDESAQ